MLINLRNALMTGKRIPYDAEVEFLESTGTQWIDTGYAVNCTTDVIDCRVAVTSVKTYGTAFGVYESMDGGGKFFGIRRNGTQDSWQSLWGAPSHSLYLDTFYDIHYEYGADKCRINETTGTSSADVAYTKPIYIYALNVNGATRYNAQRLYSFSVKRNGVLVCDFIPVRKGTVGYLYDRVSGKLFGNEGTGDFVLGPDVVPVEYIESHGTEWLKTDFIPNQDSQLELTFENTNTDTTVNNLWPAGAFIGSGNANTFGIRINRGDYAIGCYASPDSAIYYGTNIGVKFTALFKDKTWSISNVTSGVAGDFQCRSPLPLFAINYATTSSSYNVNGLSIARIYGFKGWSNGTLIRSFRPIRVGSGSTWEGAMMDVLTRRIYRNSGTGAFTYGNDLRYPIPSE